MPGYQVDHRCYETVQQAIEVIAAKNSGGIVQVGRDPYRVDASFVAPSYIKYQLVQLNGTDTFSKTTGITLEPCNALEVGDGVVLAWLVVSVWAAAYALTVLRRALVR